MSTKFPGDAIVTAFRRFSDMPGRRLPGMMTPTMPARPPALSVVIPAHNEADNIGALVDEVCQALRGVCRFEIVCVDDASRDATVAVLQAALPRVAELRVVCHARQGGQSAALVTGVKAARAPWIATLDGDGQNDPADLPRLLQARDAAGPEVRLFAGWRVVRRDSWAKRVGSRIANAVRQWLLRDATPDTGCGIKLFERAAFLDLPAFNHMHRYLPALFQGLGHRTLSVPVGHRPRGAGQSKYTNFGRLKVAFADLAGVAWLLRRRCVVPASELVAMNRAGTRPARAEGASR
jgi:dolichol-phosphate mannosyltransferase